LAGLTWVLNVMTRWKPDIVHINSWSGWSPLIAAGVLGLPIVVHAHLTGLAPYREALSFADWIVAVSESTREVVLAQGVSADRVVVVRNGVDVDRFRPGMIDRGEALRSLGQDPALRHVVMVARLAPVQNHTLALRAFARVASKLSDVRLLLVGEAFLIESTIGRVSREARELGIADKVSWLGHLSDVRPALAAADAFILCSNVEASPPLAFLEALAAGVPAIVTNTGSVDTMFKSGRTCVIINRGDEHALADALSRILGDEAFAAAIGRQGRMAVTEQWSLSRFATEMTAVYSSALNRRRVGAAT
jgi:glycosyltransferase involved in cell wall biosynthesis